MVHAPTGLKVPVFRPGIAPVAEGLAGRYELRHLRSRALFTDSGVELRLPSRTQESRALGWSVAGGRAVTPRAEQPRAAKLHRLLGPEESWEREVPTYGRLRYPDVLPGVELWFEERAEGVEYGFRAERGADLRRVTLEYAGAREVRVVEEGRALEVDLGEGVLREQGLHCAQEEADGAMKAVGCRFAHARPVGQERWAYAIEVEVEDPERPVVVDPLVLWNTYLGGRGEYSELRAIQQNSTGDVFVVGTTDTPPVSPPLDVNRAFGGLGGSFDVLVARFNRDGGLVWSALLGGGGGDIGMALAIGDADELYIAGSTGSPDFQQPLPGGGTASSPTLGSVDGFVARLDPTGTQLGWFVRLGGNNVDFVNNLLRTPDRQLYVIGYTLSTNIPNLKGVTDPTIRGEEGFIARVNPDVTPTAPLWTVLVQGPGNESLYGLAHDGSGALYVTGRTAPVSGGSQDALVAVINGIGTLSPSIAKQFSLGGSRLEEGRAVRIGGTPTQREVQVFGTTESADFAGGVRGGSDAFVATYPTYASNINMPQQKLGLLGSTAGGEYLLSLTADASGRIYIGGTTTSLLGFPTNEAFDSSFSGGLWDGFVARVNLDAQPVLEWASYVGGEAEEQVYALQVDRLNPARLLIGGSTNSTELMYSDAGYDTSPNPDASKEMFLMTVDLAAPTPVPPGSDGGTPPNGGGTSAPDAGEPGPVRSPVGWSCDSSTSGDGPAALALIALAGLALLVSRRRRAVPPRA
jgi:MYXO-CTERM domain-containing protein